MKKIDYVISTAKELNDIYMPFISGGGLFIPTTETYALNETILLQLQLPNACEFISIEGKIVWITPKHALYQALQGIGIQLTGSSAHTHHHQIQSLLDPTHEVGTYAYWVDEDANK